jgi:hypothetical protein
MLLSQKSKICEIKNSHEECGVAGSQTLFYRSFRDPAKIMFNVSWKKYLISISLMRQ